MSGFLLDTNCISELLRPKPELRVVDWMEAADETMLYLSTHIRNYGDVFRSGRGSQPFASDLG
jgi:hypothetical protein